ncbi:alpha/beta fold hydrolase [Conexibacter sp. SYSU D00693]|uniref:alpha/beta fold hydrolase n=1 Tax=Conexibacter sp. SYSU D00693 TaxID=2812560 RepID=UPI00196B35AD|nr:alpha/beta fold hydrolase [Conexibacter sp. SYSU D00693]
MPRRPLLLAAALLATALTSAAPAGAAIKTKPCKDQAPLRCGSVKVPLDRTGRVPGEVTIQVAMERRAKGDTGALIALAGGPGQGAVAVASSFREVLAPLLKRRQLVVVDQRGTGDSGVLVCPRLQVLGSLDPVRPSLVRDCADRIGPRRQAYTTADTVEDLDAVRAAVGADRWMVLGISYGTFVAQQYARAHPDRVEGLVLDSVVPDDGFDPFLLDSYTRVARVLREQCANRRCKGVTEDPVADVAAVTEQLRAGPLRGARFTATGKRVTAELENSSSLYLTLLAGDVNPFLQPELPSAIKAARAGDPAQLLRAAHIATGSRTGSKELSVGLNVTTACGDGGLPYTFDMPVEERAARLEAGLAAIPPSSVAPLDLDAVRRTSIADDCQLWPQGDVFTKPVSGALPDVPALVLAGRLDLRTPMEDALEVAKALPQAQLVRVAGTGHDVQDADLSGCVETALRRFGDGRRVGTPCKGRSNTGSAYSPAPRSVAELERARGVAGLRGRVVTAIALTIADAQVLTLQRLVGGFTDQADGCLRGGRFRATGFAETVTLRSCSYVPGLRLTGKLGIDGGTLRVRGVRGASGTVRVDEAGYIAGTLGGERVREARPEARRIVAAAARAGAARAQLDARRAQLPALRAQARRLVAARAAGVGSR